MRSVVVGLMPFSAQIRFTVVMRGRALGYGWLRVGEIYDHNAASRRCFQSAGFRVYEKTARGSRFELLL